MADQDAGADGTKDKVLQPWLHAWHDPIAGIRAFSNCIKMADLDGNGDHKLLVADAGQKKLRVYRGTSLLEDLALMEDPIAVCTFFPDNNKPRIPSIAVAASSSVYIYRNMRPCFKFSLPTSELDPQEREVWSQLAEMSLDCESAYEMLMACRDNGVSLSTRSMDLLSIDDPEGRYAYVEDNKRSPLVRQTVVTCMNVINKNTEEEDSGISQLVIGTESKQVLFLDQTGCSILAKVHLKSVPVFMSISGAFDVDYRVCVACRDGKIYTVRNGEVTSSVIELEAQPVGIVRVDKQIVVACMKNTVQSFHVKGKKSFSLYMQHPICAIEVMSTQRSRMSKLLLVALGNGEVRLYNQKHLIGVLDTNDVVTGMKFGQYGREESSLILVCRTGALSIKLLQRQVNLEVSQTPPGPPPEQDIPLNIPKKTQLYVEQTQRERDHSTGMHRTFQRDLCKLRLNTARAYVKILTDHEAPVMQCSSASLRMNAAVTGLGPLFKVKLSLQNTGAQTVKNVHIAFSYKQDMYSIKHPVVKVPILITGLLYNYEREVRCIDQTGGADVIKVFVCTADSTIPVIIAMVNMPISDTSEAM